MENDKSNRAFGTDPLPPNSTHQWFQLLGRFIRHNANGNVHQADTLIPSLVDGLEMILNQKHSRNGGRGNRTSTSPVQDAEIVKLLRALPRLTYDEIGRRVGVTAAVVNRVAHNTKDPQS